MKVKFNRDQKMLYLILLPFIIWYAVFMFKPMYGSIVLEMVSEAYVWNGNSL